MQSPRGPTFVSVPVDDWDRAGTPVPAREVSGAGRRRPGAAGARRRRCSRPRAVRCIVVGAAVARDGAWARGRRARRAASGAVWVSPLSARNSFPERHPLFAGFLPADRAQDRRATRRERPDRGARRAGLHVPHRGRGPARPGGGRAGAADRRSGRRGTCPGGARDRHGPEVGDPCAARGQRARTAGTRAAGACRTAAARSPHRWVSHAADRSPATRAQHRGGRGAEQPRRHA